MQNLYQPKKVKILQVIKETPDTKTYVLNSKDKFIPGQFLMVGLWGIGESPISISGESDNTKISLSIKKVGALTREIHKLKKGDYLWLRGPFGRGFDIETLKQKEILVIAGGVGLAPLRPLINSLLKQRNDFKNVFILYGAKTPDELLFKKDLSTWSKKKDLRLLLTVDNPDRKWRYAKGVVTELLGKVDFISEQTAAIVCGPPLMMKYTVFELLKRNINASQITLSLERHMKCGIGKCGHCYLGEKFVCLDGPVFQYSELLKLRPEIEL